MAVGKVKWFNFRKGYGFIEAEGQEKDIFVHITAVHDSGLRGLKENQKVEFDLNTDENGRGSASNIVVKE